VYLLILNILFLLFPSNHSSFENELNNYLKKNLADYLEYQYQVEDNLSEYKSIEINFNRSANRIGKNFFVPVKVIDTRGIEREKYLQIGIKLFETVLVATMPIERGEELNSTNTTWKEEDVTSLRQQPIKKENELGSVIAEYDLQPGDVVCYDFIENSPVLNPGDKVELFYTRGTVVINFPGVSRQSGAIGEVIKVRANGRQYSAKIINSQEALIIE